MTLSSSLSSAFIPAVPVKGGAAFLKSPGQYAGGSKLALGGDVNKRMPALAFARPSVLRQAPLGARSLRAAAFQPQASGSGPGRLTALYSEPETVDPQGTEPEGGPQGADKYLALRSQFSDLGVSGVLVPRGDEYFGESVPDCNERLSYLTGFTGSWGLALVQSDKAHLFVDSRYKLQAPQEVDTDQVECVCTADVPLLDGLAAAVPQGATLGYDPALHTVSEIHNYEKALGERGIKLKPLAQNPVDVVRGSQRPAFPDTTVEAYPEAFAGQSAQEKLAMMGQKLEAEGCDSAVVSLPESVCWLLNIRASDVPNTPFVLANAIVSRSGVGSDQGNSAGVSDVTVDLFVGKARISPELLAQLPPGVRLRERSEFKEVLGQMAGKRVLIDPAHCAQQALTVLNAAGADVNFSDDPTLLPKAVKNSVEIAGTKQAHVRDGAAVTRFGAWLANQAQGTVAGNITELDCVDKIAEFRADTGKLKDLSFPTIAGSGPNGAIVHYHATPESNRALQQGELLLLDSGGQYLDGTTDITRTFAFGDPSDEMRDSYTRVLKGHIDLAMAQFPQGTTGADLDPLARAPLREKGLDYGHGTGHGVGMYLGVHEGPQGISARSKVPLKAGMILSNEPGYYKTGEYGIRLENLVVVSPSAKQSRAGKPVSDLRLETIALAPFDRKLIDTKLLTAAEREWLNDYHQQVQSQIMPLMKTAEERQYLANACAPL